MIAYGATLGQLQDCIITPVKNPSGLCLERAFPLCGFISSTRFAASMPRNYPRYFTVAPDLGKLAFVPHTYIYMYVGKVLVARKKMIWTVEDRVKSLIARACRTSTWIGMPSVPS